MSIENLKIIIATHTDTTGPAQNLLEFCVNSRLLKTLFISHPLSYREGMEGSSWALYAGGEKIKGDGLKNAKRNDLPDYIRHTLLNFWWVLKARGKWDIFVGVDNLNAFCGIILRWMGKTNKVIYYTIDFVPDRFDNKVLDKIYHWADIFCVKNADITWNLSPRMAQGREKHLGLKENYRNKQILVPEGVWFDRIEKYPFEMVNKHCLVFLGHLVPRLGVQKAIEAVPEIIKAIPDFQFIIIGKGEYKEELKNLAQKLQVDKYVKFEGFIPDHRDVEKIIAKCAVGIAPYSDDEKSFSYYADPSKTKIYMGCGLPVIMTDIFYNAKEIEDAGAGKIVGYDSSEIASAVINMLSNEKKLKEYKELATEYAKNLDWNAIFIEKLNNLAQIS